MKELAGADDHVQRTQMSMILLISLNTGGFKYPSLLWSNTEMASSCATPSVAQSFESIWFMSDKNIFYVQMEYLQLYWSRPASSAS